MTNGGLGETAVSIPSSHKNDGFIFLHIIKIPIIIVVVVYKKGPRSF